MNKVAIELKGVSNFILKDVNLKIYENELFVLLGPTGSGKTTLLNVVAGLTPHKGSLFLNGNLSNSIPTNKREIGYLFQNLSLFPHLNVKSNIAYGLKVKKWPKERIEKRVEQLLDFFNIRNIGDRYPLHLSGGEKQRVALARAIAPKPKLLLLDEPLSNIDFRTSKYLRAEFKQIHKKLKITAIYVTHNLLEAEELADRIGVIRSGIIEQVGTVEEIFLYPKNKNVYDFVGAPNILTCNMIKVLGSGLAEVICRNIPIIIPYEGEKVKKIAIPPNHISIYKEKPPGPDINRFKGVVKEIEDLGFIIRVKVKVGDNLLLAEITKDIYEELSIKIGDEIYVILKLRWIRAV